MLARRWRAIDGTGASAAYTLAFVLPDAWRYAAMPAFAIDVEYRCPVCRLSRPSARESLIVHDSRQQRRSPFTFNILAPRHHTA